MIKLTIHNDKPLKVEIVKNPHAQALGSLGGKKSSANMTKEQRIERARKAGQAKGKKL